MRRIFIPLSKALYPYIDLACNVQVNNFLMLNRSFEIKEYFYILLFKLKMINSLHKLMVLLSKNYLIQCTICMKSASVNSYFVALIAFKI